MRVLHLDTEMTWRGGENQLRLLLEGLRDKNVENHVAVRPGSAAAKRLQGLAQIVEIPMRGGFDPFAAWRLHRYCKKHGIQLIDAHTGNGHSLGLLVKRFSPAIKLVVHRRVDFRPGDGLTHKKKYLSPQIDRYVAISDAIKGVLTSYGVPADRVRVVKSAVPTDGYKAFDRAKEKQDLASTFSIDPALPFIGNAAAMTHQKGYETLIDAVKILKDQGQQFHVFIAGDGELARPLEAQRANLGLEHDITFLGFIDQVPRFLSALDIMAAPSRFEGLGTVLLDAIAAGCALAATRVGGIPEIIDPGETGLLSEVEDAKGLAANLALLIKDPPLRRRLNAAARARLTREFSVDAMVHGNLALYRELLK